jgi:hypothetical protein
MNRTMLMRTTGFRRSEFDEGFELFAFTLRKGDIERWLGLIGEAKRLAAIDGDFKFLVMEATDGRWLPRESVPADVLEKLDATDEHLLLDVKPIDHEGSCPNRYDEFTVTPTKVYWSCNANAGDADWMIDTEEISEEDLISMAAMPVSA